MRVVTVVMEPGSEDQPFCPLSITWLSFWSWSRHVEVCFPQTKVLCSEYFNYTVMHVVAFETFPIVVLRNWVLREATCWTYLEFFHISRHNLEAPQIFIKYGAGACSCVNL